ncbi:galactosyltransferase-related protein [Clostridium autoethanogenum]|uniref:Galactosyltransferase-related protein n=1 Tax=Clostridium autoethanogenum DSM 10061 TaxID=1341692 RepID=A0ABN4BPJ5_9CLOT|nr:galactosyltransferase-related protein [Clostridium autoethanogenum]AGY78211.1 galactosyltransferase-related protein [Clostridium autoethanogenum DSM 10061]ALU38343.1 Glycosyl transferase capsule biosynthesis protein [Clostridium autoethanogenum DSM 10061]OVY51106.1 Galactosyltransferase [Clostridium autoethanogenum]
MFDERISVLIPYKSDGGYRDRNWKWIKKRYKALMPGAEICIGVYDKEPFCKSAAVNTAAKIATRDIFIIADADIIFDIDQIAKAILGLTYCSWIIPFNSIDYLTAKQSRKLRKMHPDIDVKYIDFKGCSRLNCNEIYGGINVVPRKYFEKVGGFDEAFKGWGEEDDAFQRAMDAICGPYGRIATNMWHMYHDVSPYKFHHKKNLKLLDKFYGNKDAIISRLNKKNILYNV